MRKAVGASLCIAMAVVAFAAAPARAGGGGTFDDLAADLPIMTGVSLKDMIAIGPIAELLSGTARAGLARVRLVDRGVQQA